MKLNGPRDEPGALGRLESAYSAKNNSRGQRAKLLSSTGQASDFKYITSTIAEHRERPVDAVTELCSAGGITLGI